MRPAREQACIKCGGSVLSRLNLPVCVNCAPPTCIVHFSGGVRKKALEILPGWPCCKSGNAAERVRFDGNQTDDANDVTCRVCLRIMSLDIRLRHDFKDADGGLLCQRCGVFFWQGAYIWTGRIRWRVESRRPKCPPKDSSHITVKAVSPSRKLRGSHDHT